MLPINLYEIRSTLVMWSWLLICQFNKLSSSIVHQLFDLNNANHFLVGSAKRGDSARGPLVRTILTSEPSLLRVPSAFRLMYSKRVNLVNPHLFDTISFWLPGNLFLARLKASKAFLMSAYLILTEYRMDPILTLAALPYDLPKAPLIPACSLSAPAHDNILLILSTCHGWIRQRRWKLSLPTCLVRYLLQAIREAYRASEEICSTSSETIWTLKGKSSTEAFLRPMS